MFINRGVMLRKHWRSALDILSSIVTLAVLIYVSVAVFQVRKQNSILANSTSHMIDQDRINPQALAKVMPDVKKTNLLVALSVNCTYCGRSRDLYLSLFQKTTTGQASQILFDFP